MGVCKLLESLAHNWKLYKQCLDNKSLLEIQCTVSMYCKEYAKKEILLQIFIYVVVVFRPFNVFVKQMGSGCQSFPLC